MNINNTYFISIPQGNIAVWDSQGSEKPVLFIHGNSACKEVFKHQMNSPLAKQYRFIAIDLSGHGESDKAKNPAETYNIEGHAQVVIEVIKKLKLENPTIIGWSLGGHIGIHLLQKAQKLAGLLITGTPPIKISKEGFEQGFEFDSKLFSLLKQIQFSKEEASDFMKAGGFDTEKDAFIVEAALKTDGYARHYLMEGNMKERGGDQKEAVETNETPLCIVQGENDKNIKNDYIISQVKYKNLFNQVHILKNIGHAAFFYQAIEFNEILASFLDHIYSNRSDEKTKA